MLHQRIIPWSKLVVNPTTAVRSLNIRKGIIGCFATRHSTITKGTKSAVPMTKGARVAEERHGLDTPPEVSPTRKRVDAAVKIASPIQSIRAILTRNADSSFWRLREYDRPRMQTTQIGTLIQNTTRQVVNWPIAPPIGTYCEQTSATVYETRRLTTEGPAFLTPAIVPNAQAKADIAM